MTEVTIYDIIQLVAALALIAAFLVVSAWGIAFAAWCLSELFRHHSGWGD